MSAHDWPDFGKHPNPCYTENGNGDRYAIRLSREAYNYAKVRIDACAGIPTEALEVTHGLDDIYNDIIRERDVEMAKRVIAEQQNAALQQRCEDLVDIAHECQKIIKELCACYSHHEPIATLERIEAIKQVQP